MTAVPGEYDPGADMKDYRIRHEGNAFDIKRCHNTGRESFLGYAKTRLVRFRVLKKTAFIALEGM